MKKILLVAFFVLGMIVLANAQVNGRAIGLRFGGGTYSGAEISYQHGIGSANRIELDLGFGGYKGHNRMFLAGVYHWDMNIVESLNWYIGPGASLGFYHYDGIADYIGVALGGQVGLEYDFNSLDVPVLISIDARPMWDFIGDNAGLGWGGALGVRYTF